jgi:hypothetical protein
MCREMPSLNTMLLPRYVEDDEKQWMSHIPETLDRNESSSLLQIKAVCSLSGTLLPQ